MDKIQTKINPGDFLKSLNIKLQNIRGGLYEQKQTHSFRTSSFKIPPLNPQIYHKQFK